MIVLIVSKKGRRYKLNRSKWTRYKNFKDMYDNVEEEMIDAGIASKLDSPIYMDHAGNSVDGETRKDIVGMKVKVRLNCPDMCVVLDEVGSIVGNKKGPCSYTCITG
jgi:hypothetical protein